ncbi:MAG: GlsB/YeaQ/YmgE family stress response membrane protein [Roseimicrobium sp.]
MILQSILIWIVLGLVAGILAKWIMPGAQGWNPVTSIFLGISGSFVGGYFGNVIGVGEVGVFSIIGIITAIAGALLLMFVWGLIFGKQG